MTSQESDDEVRELVRRHRVFVVELSAVHDHPAHPPSPGCPECAPVHAALQQRIAAAVLPRGVPG